MVTMSPTTKTELKTRILRDVALWFAAKCPLTMEIEVRDEFQKIFDESIGAGIEKNKITSYTKAQQIYIRRKTRKLAHDVCTVSTGTISKDDLRAIADEFLKKQNKWYRKAFAKLDKQADAATGTAQVAFQTKMAEVELQTVFCDQYK